jgi:predicted transcriptional regulator
MTRKLYEIAADIIEAQASMIEMSPDSLEQTLSTVFVTLQKMKMAEDGGFLLDDQSKPSEEAVQEVAAEKIDAKSSIQEDKVICLECGAEMRQLTAKHLSSHGLSNREYRSKYGINLGQPLSAKSLTRARSKAAKKRGLPEKLLQLQETRRQEKTEAAAMTEGAEVTSPPINKVKTKAPAKNKAQAKTKAPSKKRSKKAE